MVLEAHFGGNAHDLTITARLSIFGTLSLGALLGVIFGTIGGIAFLVAPPHGTLGRPSHSATGGVRASQKRSCAASKVRQQDRGAQACLCKKQGSREGLLYPANVLWNTVGVRGSFDNKCATVVAQRVLDHPNVLKVYGVTSGDDGCEVIAVTEFATKGTLAELLNNPSVEMTTASKLRLALDVALGLQYLHSLQPAEVGRKLRTHHLLLNDNYVCILNNCFTRSVTGSGRSRLYMAPELLRGKQMTMATDMYAFGMLLWEIIHRKQVYESD